MIGEVVERFVIVRKAIVWLVLFFGLAKPWIEAIGPERSVLGAGRVADEEVVEPMELEERLQLNLDGVTVTVNVRIAGTGPRVLFVHGLYHSGQIWQLVQERLADRFETVAIDLPGFGASPPLTPRTVTLENYARILSEAATFLSAKQPFRGIVADSPLCQHI